MHMNGHRGLNGRKTLRWDSPFARDTTPSQRPSLHCRETSRATIKTRQLYLDLRPMRYGRIGPPELDQQGRVCQEPRTILGFVRPAGFGPPVRRGSWLRRESRRGTAIGYRAHYIFAIS